jgi:CPA1 family monovalent cation:H+ antiporter
MDIVFTVLVLLLSVAISGIKLRRPLLPFRLPLPVVQIAIGAMLSLPQLGLHVTFDPELFMMLFIPPLLFADGWRIPKREFFRQRSAILMLALGLVFVTVLVTGWSVHMLVPAISLPVAFALGAVLAPTDAVALSGIAGKNRVPASLMHMLEGEALMNDASGLVALKFAIGAALSGVFSLRDASVSFLFIATGGLATGVAVSWIFSLVSARVLNVARDSDPAPGVVMTLLIPFAAYLFAEHFGCSGVLASVAAGMAMNYTKIAHISPVAARVQAANTWSMIEFVFNGMVFILLGLQCPDIVGRALLEAHVAGDAQVWDLIGYVVAVLALLYAIRFFWIWLLRAWQARQAAKMGMTSAGPGLHMTAVMTVAGVRGAVTLAGILSLPLTRPNGVPFPGRHIAIFIAAGVILVSLFVAVVTMPFLLRRMSGASHPLAEEEERARAHIAQAAVLAIDTTFARLTAQSDSQTRADAELVAARLKDQHLRNLAVLSREAVVSGRALRGQTMELQMRVDAMRAQRVVLLHLRAEHRINDETLNKLMHEVDLSETALTHSWGKPPATATESVE